MAFDDQYRGLIEDASDAIGELLNASTPDSWLRLRADYGQLCRTLESDDRARECGEDERRQREWEAQRDDQRDRRAEWRRSSAASRESLLLQALGDERLVIREITPRLNAQLGSYEKGWQTLYESDVRRLAMRMCHSGQLERAAEKFQGKVRYRYHRKRTLNGPIADLERTYQQGERKVV